MKLPQLAINNYQFVVVMVFMAVALGLLSFFNMPRSEDPTMTLPIYNVVAVYPGASPEDMEELVVDPIEESLKEVEDVRKIKTTIQDGLAVINVEGEYGINTEDQLDEINTQVSSIRGDLPSGLIKLEVDQITPLDVVILQTALISEDIPYRSLQDWAEKLEDELEKVKGVREVKVEGYPEEEVRIALDFEKMSQLNLSLNQVMGIIQANNANIPAGEIRSGNQNFTLKTSGGYESIQQLENTVVAAGESQVIYLRDIAQIYMGYEDDKYLARFNGERAVFVSTTQKKGFNILQISDDMNAVIGEFQKELPATIQMAPVFQQGPAVEGRINDFFMNLFQGIFLVGAIILMFLGFRNSLIVMTVIPTSIVMAIFMLDSSGFGLQQISIAGLVIALGLLVDNGIVVVENIYRYLQEGFPLKEAAAKGTGEVGWAIVSSTATTVLAFFPMTQLGGGTGEFLQSMPLIVIFSLLASLLLALALTPLLGSKLMKLPKSGKLPWGQRGMQILVENGYRKLLAFSLRRPWVIIALAVVSFAGSVALFPIVGVSFFPTADKPLLVVDIELPEGQHLGRTNEAAKFVESVLDTTKGVKNYALNVGHSNPQIYYNIVPKNYTPHFAQAVVNLDEWKASSFYTIIDQLRANFDQYPGAKISVTELKNGPPYDAPISIKVIGDDLDQIRLLAEKVEGIIASVKGTVNVNNPLAMRKAQLRTQIQRDKAGMLGVQVADIDLAVRTAVTGNNLGTMNASSGDKYNMVARMDYADRAEMSDLQRVSVASVTGAQVPLSQLVSLELEPSISSIDHFDLKRTATVTSDVREGFNSSEMTLAVIDQLEEMEWPQGYDYYVAGEYETQQESFGDLGQMLIVALLGIFAVLILQFRSFRQPFVVLAAIPLAFSGSIVALFLSGFSFSFLAFVGFTSLVGIVVNTSIILVDYTNQLVEKGISIIDAIQQAGETRFTPILLTTMTTIFGLLPLTLTNSNLWSPLGWTIIGGMISSTLLTLLIVPILYKWMTVERVKTV